MARNRDVCGVEMTELSLVQLDGLQLISGSDDPIEVPSGQVITLQEVIWNAPGPFGLVARFRFVAPAIARGDAAIDFTLASADMLHLCQTYALTRVADLGPVPSQIIVSLASAPVPFGQPAPDITQYFEAYRVEDQICIWEQF